MKHKNCPYCGRKMPRKYSHRINRPMCEAMLESHLCHEHKGIVSRLNINHSQINNFHKLKYWGLVESCPDNEWQVTELGKRYLRGVAHIPSCVYTVNNQRVDFGDKWVMIDDVLNPKWRNRKDYAKLFYNQDYGVPRLFDA